MHIKSTGREKRLGPLQLFGFGKAVHQKQGPAAQAATSMLLSGRRSCFLFSFSFFVFYSAVVEIRDTTGTYIHTTYINIHSIHKRASPLPVHTYCYISVNVKLLKSPWFHWYNSLCPIPRRDLTKLFFYLLYCTVLTLPPLPPGFVFDYKGVGPVASA